LLNDSAHCGTCAATCAPLETCTGGRCECAHTLCSGSCVKLDSDPKNCGSCGRDCLGGGCVDGECEAIPVVLDDSAVAIAVDATSVYWQSPANNDIRKANLDGSNEVSLAAAPYPSGPKSIAVSGSTIYWGSNYGIWMAPIDGSAAGTRVWKDVADALAVDATHLYFTDEDVGVYRADLDGSNPTLIAAGKQGREFVLADGVIYWAQYAFAGPGQILRVGTDGTGQQILAQSAAVSTNEYMAGTIALYGASLYFGGYYGGTLAYTGIFSEALNGSPLRTLVQARPEKLLADDRSVYWAETGNLWRVANTGGQPRLVASVPLIGRGCCTFEDLVQDDAFVYFCTDTTAGGIWKVAK
jgi:hypothetical protein